MSVAIREATDADRPALLDLWAEAWSAALPEIDFEARRPWFTTHLDTLKRDGASIFVAVAPGGPILAFVVVDPVKQEMDQLVTALSAQRLGLGRRLVRFAKNRSPMGLSLTVNVFNLRAINLYRSEGFSVVGEGISSRSGLPVHHMRWIA